MNTIRVGHRFPIKIPTDDASRIALRERLEQIVAIAPKMAERHGGALSLCEIDEVVWIHSPEQPPHIWGFVYELSQRVRDHRQFDAELSRLIQEAMK